MGAVGRLPDGTAFAVVTRGEVDALHEVWPLVAAGEPAVPLYGATVAEAKDLNGALAQARYALSSARSTACHGSVLTDASALTGLDALLTGVPAEVRTAFSRAVLGELRGNAVLLETLETFLSPVVTSPASTTDSTCGRPCCAGRTGPSLHVTGEVRDAVASAGVPRRARP
ncbi:hypothetical protein [Streptomyces hokutonensis]|uniref:hypothetical protein n=1 Tax=Streptomyces hokutonensis TaxID=1306990 RepID=UPI0033FA03BD